MKEQGLKKREPVLDSKSYKRHWLMKNKKY